MLASINGQIVERTNATGRRSGIRMALGGRRVYLALGHERDGWSRELTDTALLVIKAACRAQQQDRHRQRRRPRRG